jgi:hypothetical protein
MVNKNLIIRFSNFLVEFSNRRNTIILIILFVLVNLFMFSPLSPMTVLDSYSDNAGMLDLDFIYDSEKAYDVVSAYGVEGRRYYVTTFVLIDTFTPILMNLFLSVLVTMVLRLSNGPKNTLTRLNILPFIALIGDYLENIFISVIMLNYPDQLENVVFLASFSTGIKFVFTFASGFVIIVGLVYWFFKRK